MGSLMGSSATSSSTSVNVPKWLSDLVKPYYQNTLIPGIENTAAQGYNPYTGQRVAGFNQDQTNSFGLTNGLVGQAQGQLGAAAGMQGNIAMQGLNGMDPNLIQSYMNPYTSNVINANNRLALQNYDQQRQQLQGQEGQIGAFGGSRTAIGEQQLNKNFYNGLQAQNAGLLSQGYGQALGAAQSGLKLSDIAASQYGQNAMQTQQAGLQQAQALSAQGNQQQSLAQQNLNVPYQNFLQAQQFPYAQEQYAQSMLGPIVGQFSGTTQTQSGGNPGLLGTALGIGSMVSGFGGLSGMASGLGSFFGGGSLMSGAGAAAAGGSDLASSMMAAAFLSKGGQVPMFHKTGDGQHEYGSYAGGGMISQLPLPAMTPPQGPFSGGMLGGMGDMHGGNHISGMGHPHGPGLFGAGGGGFGGGGFGTATQGVIPIMPQGFQGFDNGGAVNGWFNPMIGGMNPMVNPAMTTGGLGYNPMIGGQTPFPNGPMDPTQAGVHSGRMSGGMADPNKPMRGHGSHFGYASGGLVDPYGNGSAETPFSGVAPDMERGARGPYDSRGMGPYSVGLTHMAARHPRMSMRSSSRMMGASAKPPKVGLLPLTGATHLAQGGIVGAIDGFHDTMHFMKGGLCGYQNGGMIPHGMYADGGLIADGGSQDTLPGYNSGDTLDGFLPPGGLGDYFSNAGHKIASAFPGLNSSDDLSTMDKMKMSLKLLQMANAKHPTLAGTAMTHPGAMANIALMGDPALMEGAGAAAMKAGSYLPDMSKLAQLAKVNPQLAARLGRGVGLAGLNFKDVQNFFDGDHLDLLNHNRQSMGLPEKSHLDNLSPDEKAAHDKMAQAVGVDPTQEWQAAMKAKGLVAKAGSPLANQLDDPNNQSVTDGNTTYGPLGPAGNLPIDNSQPSPSDRAKAVALGGQEASLSPSASKSYDQMNPQDALDKMRSDTQKITSNPDQGKVNLPLVQFGAALLGSRRNFFSALGEAGQAYSSQKNAEDVNNMRMQLLDQIQGTRQEKADAYSKSVDEIGAMAPYKMEAAKYNAQAAMMRAQAAGGGGLLDKSTQRLLNSFSMNPTSVEMLDPTGLFRTGKDKDGQPMRTPDDFANLAKSMAQQGMSQGLAGQQLGGDGQQQSIPEQSMTWDMLGH